MLLRKKKRKQAGQVLILGTVTSVVLFGFLGLAFDVGYLYMQRRRVQTAADAAALGAVQALKRGNSTNQIVAAGKTDAGLNGFTDGTAGVTATINNPPLSGNHTGDSNYVEAIVSQPLGTYFMRVVNVNSATVAARAEATIGPGQNCVYLLDPSAEDELLVDGTFRASCGVIANSTSASKALDLNSGTATANRFSSVGGWIGNFSPQPQSGVAPVGDPLAYLQPPVFPAQNYYGVTVNNSTPLNPGVYHGGIHVMAGVQAVFNPGVYILNGGYGLTAEGGPNSNLSGTGVTFYFTANQPVPSPPPSFNTSVTRTPAGFLMNGQSGANLVAPTSGPMAGILFFQDRNPANQATLFDIQGSSSTRFEGVLYIPGADLLYQNSTVNTAAYTIIISRTLRLNGGGANLTISSDYSSLANGSPLKVQAVLTQ